MYSTWSVSDILDALLYATEGNKMRTRINVADVCTIAGDLAQCALEGLDKELAPMEVAKMLRKAAGMLRECGSELAGIMTGRKITRAVRAELKKASINTINLAISYEGLAHILEDQPVLH